MVETWSSCSKFHPNDSVDPRLARAEDQAGTGSGQSVSLPSLGT